MVNIAQSKAECYIYLSQDSHQRAVYFHTNKLKWQVKGLVIRTVATEPIFKESVL